MTGNLLNMQNKLRVLYFTGTLEVGGLERFVTRISLKAKESNAYEPVICCLINKQGPFLSLLEEKGVKIIDAPKKWFRNLNALFALSHQIQELSPDIVHSQVNFSLGQQRFAVFLANPRIKFCVTERSQYVRQGFSLFRRIIQFYFLRFLGTDYTANSKSVANHVAGQVGINPDKIGVIPNGTAEIPENEISRKKIRERYGWEKDDFVLGYVARLAPGKGHELFVRTIAELIKNHTPIKACLVGDGELFSTIQQLISKSGLSKVFSMPGTISNVEDYLQAFDAVVLLSEREGMPNALLEAMAAGKPIIATPVGGVPEILDHGRAGILVDANLEDIVKAVETLVMNTALCRSLGQKARQQIKDHYSLDQVFEGLVSYYKNFAKT